MKQKSGVKRIGITALVTNLGSGHLMPTTAIPGIREMWLDLAVKASDGTDVFASKNNYGATLLDPNGNPTMPWNAVRAGKDTRIAPQRSRKESFWFKVSDFESGTLDARVTLYYRLISEQAAKSAGIEASSPIGIASDRILISPQGAVTKPRRN